MSKVLSFVNNKKKVDPKKSPSNYSVLSDGKLGSLSYDIHNVGGVMNTLHVTDGKLKFKKNFDDFEDKFSGLNPDSMTDGDTYVITGSGDNDNLIFTKKDGDIEISLEKKGFEILDKLRSILNHGKSSKKGASI